MKYIKVLHCITTALIIGLGADALIPNNKLFAVAFACLVAYTNTKYIMEYDRDN